jgi:endonuclease/exonuclease/phosphatase family metal-dependent hydrolase
VTDLSDPLIRVVEWNVNRAAGDRRRRQIEALAGEDADLVVLTEVAHGSAPEDYLEGMSASGLANGASSRDSIEGPPSTDGRRRFGVVLAARWPLTSVGPFPGAPWPERTLDITIAHPIGDIRVLAIYAPLGRHDTTKSETFEAAGRIIEGAHGPLIVTGDFNAPRWEGEDAQGRPVLVTFGQRRLRSGGFGPRGHRQDVAERLVLDSASLGLVDAYRTIHGYGVAVSSWSTVRSGRRWDYRLDHVLTRGGLTPLRARYRQEFRQPIEGLPRLSDHAAIEVTLTISDDGAG